MRVTQFSGPARVTRTCQLKSALGQGVTFHPLQRVASRLISITTDAPADFVNVLRCSVSTSGSGTPDWRFERDGYAILAAV